MSDRELLEKQAKELGVDFAADISDADLLQLLEVTKARADLEARATALGVKFGATIGDEKLAERVAAAEAKRDGGGGKEAPADGYTVLCAVAGGRRRGGRGWAGGKTDVAAGEMTEAMLGALDGDPLFQVTGPATE